MIDIFARRPAEPGVRRHILTGGIAWTVIVTCALGLGRFPQTLRAGISVASVYILSRVLIAAVLNAIGAVRCGRWMRRDWARLADGSPGVGLRPSDVHHLVVVPNHGEDPEVLEPTLDHLAVQYRARDRLHVVLAVEERDPKGRRTAEKLVPRFRDRFADLIVTTHPADLPGELAGKGANQAYAARAVSAVLTERGIDGDALTVTSCDADSRIDPRYFAAVSCLFASTARRYERFWQAPMLYYNNIWDVPAVVRLLSWFSHAAIMGDLVTPLYSPLPVSTYTTSLRLLERVGYWDTDVVAEDWHIFLQAFFETGGRVRTASVFLPTHADAADGPSWAASVRAAYRQAVRHSWGAEDVGYLLRRWPGSPRVPTARKAFRVAQVLHDHLMRSTTWFVMVSGSLAALTLRLGGLAPEPAVVAPVRLLGALAALSLLWMTVLETVRDPPPPDGRRARRVLGTALATAALPIVSVTLGAIPALQAQTQLMLGLPLGWIVTPKTTARTGSEMAG